jgi:vancomycin permeability regulator SanA
MKPKIKRIISICLLISFIIIQIPLLINIFMFEYSNKRIINVDDAAEMNFDCILVLGAGVWGDSPSPMLKERLNKGIEVYNTGCSDRILMSGDHGREEYDEVNVMKNYAIECGILSNNIFMDHAGFSTYESMYRARDIFQVKKVLIITQEYHLYRAVYNARQLGLDAYGVCADGEYDYDITVRTYNNSREALARCKDFVYCIFKPEPTYLGEAIPINSSGELTEG